MTAPRLFRVIVPVDDIDTAARFYATLLENSGMRISAGRHYFISGGVIVAVYDPRADGDAARAPRPNFEHIYFAVDDLEAAYRRAQQAGGLSTEIGDGGLPMGEIARRPWGERSFYLHDPFGNPVCFVDEASIYKGPPGKP